jgi:hypothetical protein
MICMTRYSTRFPGFTAEASLSRVRNANVSFLYSRDDYRISSINSEMMSENITTQFRGSPEERCNAMPCEKCDESRPGYRECYEWKPAQQECASYFVKCPGPCKPKCGPCINFSRDCTLRDCSTRTESCCPCQEAEWCISGATLVHRYCDCSVTYEPDSASCTGPI